MEFLKGLIIFILGGSIIGFLAVILGAFLTVDFGSEPTGGVVLGFILLGMGVLGFVMGGVISVILFTILKKKKW